MTLRSCMHEIEVRELMDRGHWPEACSPELRAHVDNCRACGDLVRITQAFRTARAASAANANLPPPGVLLWRAQLRRRKAALERMQRPIVGAQIFAFLVTLLIAAGVVVWQAMLGAHWLADAAGWLASLAQSPTFHLEVLWPFAGLKSGVSLTYLVPGMAMLALCGGVVAYLASDKQ